MLDACDLAPRTSARTEGLPGPGLTALLTCVLLGILVLVLASPALAYHTDGREGDYDCIDCHGDDRDPWTGEGPHGYYTTMTTKCQMCHTIHKAPVSSIILLPAATIRDSCFTCHDNTGAVGVYSSITARGGSVAASHSVELTTAVPGGSAPLSSVLTCNSCHSVHRATDVQPFLRDTGKALSSKEWIYSNCLLKDDLNGAPRSTYTTYAAEWCAACHDERHNWASPVNNHPVSQVATYFLGRSNERYGDTTDDPICQQCHEDYRDVETTFSASFKDYGFPPPDAPTNPAYVTFPHQTTSVRLLAEVDDDLCLNCHDPSELP